MVEHESQTGSQPVPLVQKISISCHEARKQVLSKLKSNVLFRCLLVPIFKIARNCANFGIFVEDVVLLICRLDWT